MFKTLVISSAILLGMAVPLEAQRGANREREMRWETVQVDRGRQIERRGSTRTVRHRSGSVRPRPVAHRAPRRHWVPARTRRVFVPAVYELRWDPCLRRRVRVCVHQAYYRTVCEPGYWACDGRRGGRSVSFRF